MLSETLEVESSPGLYVPAKSFPRLKVSLLVNQRVLSIRKCCSSWKISMQKRFDLTILRGQRMLSY